MTSYAENIEAMSTDMNPIQSIMTPGVNAAETSAATMTSTENVDKDEKIPPYMQGRFLGALATWKTAEPLDNNNWIAWKGQITPMLMLNGVWGHCDGTDLRPVNNPRHQEQCIRKLVMKR